MNKIRLRDTLVDRAPILIAIIAAAAALEIGESIFAPLVLAFVAGIVVSPLTRFLDKIGMPPVIGAASVLIMFVFGVLTLAFFLQPMVSNALSKIPTIWIEVRSTVISLQETMRGLEDVSKDVAEAISNDNGNGDAAPKEEQIAVPTASDALAFAPTIAAQVMVFVGALFFFVLSRNQIYAWAGKVFRKGDELEQRLLFSEKMVARYFLTITMINAGFGVVIAAAMLAIGMPSPLTWGLLAMLLNYILYIGPISLAVILLLAGVVTFNGPMVAAPAALYLTLNMLEGQFVTPALVGQRLSVNPLLVFLSLVFWLWLWGPLGGFVAIPVMLWGLVMSGAVPHE
ncbi:AI-2E family transporter [Stappia sp.]|uniref:AI-2E family transporter n=1 Tax=Stappia sp. TaxID=1870903 RepID=UPI003A9902F3